MADQLVEMEVGVFEYHVNTLLCIPLVWEFGVLSMKHGVMGLNDLIGLIHQRFG